MDYRVMEAVFASHNELGRLYDEDVYKQDVRARLHGSGIHVATEVPVDVNFQDFRKRYFLDLLIDDAALYELKTVSAFVGEHEAQLLNYLMLLGLSSGKLINFRTSSVEWRFVNSPFTIDRRRRFKISCHRWQPLTTGCARLREVMTALLADWGAFLDLALYEEALEHFLGGNEVVSARVPVMRDSIPLGSERVSLVSPEIAFRLTAFTEKLNYAEAHLQRLLNHTPLHAMQWMNLSHAELQLITLTSSKESKR